MSYTTYRSLFTHPVRLLFALALALAPILGLATAGTARAAGLGGSVVAWGFNGFGQTNVPTGLSNVTAIAAGAAHSLALTSDGSVVAWGCGTSDSNLGQCSVPATLTNVTAIAAGRFHSVALKRDGSVIAWGYDYSRQATVPPELTDVTAISAAASGDHTVALKRDGSVVAWGDNSQGQASVPSGLSDVTAVAAGSWHTLALKRDGSVVAWGCKDWSNNGQCSVPANLTDVIAIAAGAYHSVALKRDGTVVAWGQSSLDQTNVPANLTDVSAIAAGSWHTLALKRGSVVAWGCGDSVINHEQCNIPAGLNGVTAIAAGHLHTLALVSPDTLAPTASPSIAPAANSAGWNNTDVNVSWNWADNEGGSGIDTAACPPTSASSGEGQQTLSASCTDKAGNQGSASYTLKIDKTAPLVSMSGVTDGASYTLGAVPAAACSASDVLSGVATEATLGITGGNADGTGNFIVTCAGATDLAGNSAPPISMTYQVLYRWAGFFQPLDNLPTLNSVKAGQAIPVTFSLGGNYGLNILVSGSPASQPIACASGAPIDEIEQTATAGASGLHYDAASGQYSYTWKTDKSWAGQCRQLVVRLVDGSEHIASFKFK